jgi:hypothetical protein
MTGNQHFRIPTADYADDTDILDQILSVPYALSAVQMIFLLQEYTNGLSCLTALGTARSTSNSVWFKVDEASRLVSSDLIRHLSPRAQRGETPRLPSQVQEIRILGVLALPRPQQGGRPLLGRLPFEKMLLSEIKNAS